MWTSIDEGANAAPVRVPLGKVFNITRRGVLISISIQIGPSPKGFHKVAVRETLGEDDCVEFKPEGVA